MSRAPKLLLAGAATAARARPARAYAAAPPPTTTWTAPPTATVPAIGAQPGSGIQVGPAAPPNAGTPGGGTVGGDQASHPHFWDLPGRIRKAIDDWFKGLVLDALNPTLELVGKTVLATPQLASNAQVAGLWQISLVAADALLVLFLLVGAGAGDEPRDDAEPVRAQGSDPPTRLHRHRRSTPASACAVS